ncbi:adenylate kinase [Parvularcula dongshanensis]|uniref:Adenylate kinase n=1 Tax=Parvularcula dongshanensis TaxID=1173995 RepID=A0A840I2D8_9PROT|nr:adenylate kinase [Parvularcula dongshanensis]MBB4658897.1 adenylate kinase [Parvularcula dongshanensis]
MIVIFLGPPGAGKGTQAAYISARRDIPQLSTGDMLRAAIAAGSDVGRQAKAIIDRGELVSDDIVAGIISERIDMADCARGFLLDGFPRTVEQARMLDEMLTRKGKSLDCVLLLDVDHDALEARRAKRVAETEAAGAPPRRDDDPATFAKRQGVYREQTAPLVPHYEAQGLLKTIDGMQPVEAVSAEIDSVLDAC